MQPSVWPTQDVMVEELQRRQWHVERRTVRQPDAVVANYRWPMDWCADVLALYPGRGVAY